MDKKWMIGLLAAAMVSPLVSAQTATKEPAAAEKPKAAAPAKAPAGNPNSKQAPDVAAPKLNREGEPDAGFIKRHEMYVDRAEQGNVDVLFLGDSITQGWNNNETWKKHYGPMNAANFGIGGDRTQHVLWRITNGELENIKPKVAVLMIGTNNVADNSAEQIAAGVKKIVTTLREKLPETKVLLLAVFPRAEKPDAAQRAKIKRINSTIAELNDGKNVRYLDIGEKFLEDDGTLSKEVMPDFLHLSPKGYEIWAESMKPTLDEMMK